MMTPSAEPRAPGRKRAALVVVALHALLLAVMWQTMARRTVEVRPAQPALTWVRPLSATNPVPLPPAALARAPAPRLPAPPAVQPVAPRQPTESTWVTPAPAAQPEAVAAAPAASAASAPPERLLDTAATRQALRQIGRQPLLAERAADATGLPIRRTDTALAREVAEAGTPDCLRDSKAASGEIGPVALGGILGLPFLAARAVTGGCAK